MSSGASNTLVTPERAAVLRARLLEIIAARQKAEATVARIAAGEPRETFGAFTLSFEDIERRQWKGMASQSRPAFGAGRERNFG
jgi:hypothetical protein